MSKLTLDEAIKHCLEVAEQNETSAITYKNCKEIKTNMYEKLTAEKAENDCRECAAEHRQLAEWLKELKALRELHDAETAISGFLDDSNKILNDRVRELEEQVNKREKKYKWLLGIALKAFNNGSCNKACRDCKWDGSCEMSCRFAWKYGDEALKLIGEDDNESQN